MYMMGSLRRYLASINASEEKQKCLEAPFELQKLEAVYQNLENIFKLFVDSCDLNLIHKTNPSTTFFY